MCFTVRKMTGRVDGDPPFRATLRQTVGTSICETRPGEKVLLAVKFWLDLGMIRRRR